MEIKENIKAILFDFDGTIVFLPTNYDKMRRRLLDFFLQYDVKSNFRPLIESISNLGEKLKAQGYSQSDIKSIVNDAYSIIEEEEISAIKRATLVNGAREVLNELKNNGIKFAIISRNGKKCINRCVLELNIPKPDVIVSRDDLADVNKLKPNPEHIFVCLERLKLKPIDVIIIGDSYHDILAGKIVGIKTILIRHNTEHETNIKSDCIIEKLDEILEYIS